MKAILVLTITLLTQLASASYIETCLLETKIVTKGAIQSPYGENSQYHAEIVAKVTEATTNGPSHTDCKHHIGTEISGQVDSVSLLHLASLKKGNFAKIQFRTASSFTPAGIIGGTSMHLVDSASTAYYVALNDQAVATSIEAIKKELGNPNNPAVLLTAVAQTVPENICGFVGCGNTFIVILTYGQNHMNSARDSVVVKVALDPFDQVHSIRLLQTINPALN